MPRTQSKTSRGKGALPAGSSTRAPQKAYGFEEGSGLQNSAWRGRPVFVRAGRGVAFAGGGYLRLIKSVQKVNEPRTSETHPTYIYSAPLGDNDDSRRVIGTIFEGQ